MHKQALRLWRSNSGFTLIELMVAIAIIALIAAVAFPSYQSSVRKGRRAEAFAALSAIQQAQERWRANNASYASALSDLGITSATTSGGYYGVAIDTASATGYTVTAIGVSGTSQAGDQCRTLSAQMLSGAVKYASCATCTTPFAASSYADADRCWAR
jgi:type IV pilus assembly protein PilE